MSKKLLPWLTLGLTACAASTPATDWRAAPPTPGPEPALVLPSFARAKLDNGLTVLNAKVGKLPLVSFIVVTRGGSAEDPKGAAGLTTLSYTMLGEGAGSRDALAFTNAAADLGASFGTSADQDSGSAQISGLKRNADAMLELLADAVLRPALRRNDFEREKSQMTASLIRRRGSPRGLVSEYTPSMIYGANHPYGHPAGGTIKSISGVKLDDVKTHLETLLAPQESAFIAVGDVDLDEAVEFAKRHFGAWKTSKTVRRNTIPAVQALTRSGITVIDKANSPQTLVLIGRPLFGSGAADENAARLTNTIYGGSFASRLNLNLREEKGYTYGARSSVSMRRQTGAFLAYAAIRKDVTSDGLHQFFLELVRMREKPPTGEEIDRARSSLTKSLPGAFEKISSSAQSAASLFVYDRPLDYFSDQATAYEQIGGQDVAHIADTYLVPDQMQIIVVGEADALVEPIRKLGLGEPTVVDPSAE